MIRKFLAGIIILSMALHCAGRLGLISYIFQQRHHIAHAIGLLDEVPIATCSGDYHAPNGLVIEHQSDEGALPIHLQLVQEINLFFQAGLNWNKNTIEPARSALIPYRERPYATPRSSLFHPPAIG